MCSVGVPPGIGLGNTALDFMLIINNSERAQKKAKICKPFTFTHLADAFIQSDLHCIQVTVYILSALAFPGNRTHDLGVASAMLYHLSYRKAV